MKRTLLSSFNLIMQNNVFTFNGYFHKQIKGAPMSAISGFLAEMRLIENKIMTEFQRRPTEKYGYCDDVFIVWDSCMEHLQGFLVRSMRLIGTYNL